MTNEERCRCTYNETGCSDCEWTRLIQENTDLKAEIEQLKSTISKMETVTVQEDDLK